MRVLIVKMSSMGDVIHTLPALTDAGSAIKNISFDWVVEENFQEIPKWHPLVNKVIPIALRRWRKNFFSAETRREWREFKKNLQEHEYDLIIDAQGLLKSVGIAFFARGIRAGGDFHSAREALASLFYQRKCSVSQQQHAIVRARSLFAQALGYEVPNTIPAYGVNRAQFQNSKDNYLVFLHGTTWTTKHWPEEYWLELANIVSAKGFKIKLPWGNPAERARAERIAAASHNCELLPKLNLSEMACVLASSEAVVGVDTGLGHLTAALDVPQVSLYGPTNPELTGALGHSQKHLRANFACSPCYSRECNYLKDHPASLVQPPCFATIPPKMVWSALELLLSF